MLMPKKRTQKGERAEAHAQHTERRAEREGSSLSPGFLQGAIVVLAVLVIITAYVVGYQYGKLGGLGGATPTTTTQAAAAPAQAAAQPSATPPPTVPKTATPEADLFIMSHCPYGLQMQKAFLQVQELLGSKANMQVKWVDYAMHGYSEVQDNVYEYCIQKDQPDTFVAYEKCFVEKLDYKTCAAQAGVDTAKVASCYAATDKEFGIQASWDDKSSWLSGRYPQFNIDKALNQQYGVQGSPTFVLNGQKVSVARSAEAVKEAVCNAFTSPPAACNTALNSNQEQPGQGPVGAGSAPSGTAAAGCGA